MFKWPKLYQTSFCHTRLLGQAVPLLVLITWSAPSPRTRCSYLTRMRKTSILVHVRTPSSWGDASSPHEARLVHPHIITCSVPGVANVRGSGSPAHQSSLLCTCTVKVSSSSVSTRGDRFSSLLCNRLSLFRSRQLGCRVPLRRLSVTQTVVLIYLQYVLCHFDFYFVWLVE